VTSGNPKAEYQKAGFTDIATTPAVLTWLWNKGQTATAAAGR